MVSLRDAFERGVVAPPPNTAAEASWGWQSTQRQHQLDTSEAMRRIAAETVTAHRDALANSDLRARVGGLVRQFFIPRLGTARQPSAADAFIDRGRRGLVPLFRADLTWVRYAPAWRRARVFLRRLMALDGKPWCVATLLEDPRYVTACSVWCYENTTSVSAIDTMTGAVRMAMRVNSIPVREDFLTAVVRSVARRQRGKPVRKKTALTAREASLFLRKWGCKGAPLWKLMIAAAVGVGFSALLRFSDLAVVRIDAIYFMSGTARGAVPATESRTMGAPRRPSPLNAGDGSVRGCAIFLPRRKNSQHGAGSWLPLADTGGEHSAYAVLLRLLARLGHGVPSGVDTRLDIRRYLFRDVGLMTGHTHAGFRIEGVRGDGQFPMTRTAYGHYLSRFRRGLEELCGYTKAQAKSFGLQSLRSGGDTHLFHNGVSKDVRMVVGEWATPSVEAGYVQARIRSKLATMRAVFATMT